MPITIIQKVMKAEGKKVDRCFEAEVLVNVMICMYEKPKPVSNYPSSTAISLKCVVLCCVVLYCIVYDSYALFYFTTHMHCPMKCNHSISKAGVRLVEEMCWVFIVFIRTNQIVYVSLTSIR